MSYSITTCNADLQAVLHGTTLSKVQGINNLHNRTARQLLSDIDPIETERKALTTTPFFNQIWDYACPSDLKGNRIIDISPQFQRYSSDVITQTYQQNFDIGKNLALSASQFTIQFNNSVKTIRVNDVGLPTGTVLDACESTTGWTASGTASNVSIDNLNYAVGSGSIKFNMTAGTGVLSITETASLNLSAMLNQASLFYYLYIPSATVTSTTLRFGSSASNYYSITNTTAYDGTALSVGWNLIGGTWASATVVGSPTVTAINYVYVSVTSSAALTGVAIDNIVSDMGLYRTIRYYSKFLFRNATTNAFQETVLDNSDLINLDTESYNLYFNLLAHLASAQIQGLDSLNFDSTFYGQMYESGKTRYTSINKSQVQKPQTPYYTPKQGGYGKYLGGRY